MLSIKKLLVLAVGAVALLAAGAASAAPAANPVAGAAGGDVAPLLFPAVVNVPFVRARAALARAVDYADDAQQDKAVAQLTVVRTQLKKAWAGEKYLIDHAPPPAPAGDGLIVDASGGAVAGASPFASAEDSGAELFKVYREVATTSVALMETAKATLQTALNTTIFATLNGRDAAITYIHAHQPPPPPADSIAGASGGAIASGWGTIMPTVGQLVDDEIQQLDALEAGTAASAGAKRIFRAAELQDTKTQKQINTWWPPLPVGD
jgi:hypothetical protein